MAFLKKNLDQVDRLCEQLRNVTRSQGGEEYPTFNKKKED
jgi:hypothetical protein